MNVFGQIVPITVKLKLKKNWCTHSFLARPSVTLTHIEASTFGMGDGRMFNLKIVGSVRISWSMCTILSNTGNVTEAYSLSINTLFGGSKRLQC